MIISNKVQAILNYKIEDSFLIPSNRQSSIQQLETNTKVHQGQKVKPTTHISENIYVKNKNKGSLDIFFSASFLDIILKTPIIEYKGLLSFDFITENEEKDHMDMEKIYESGYNFMIKTVSDNCLHYAHKIEFHSYKYPHPKLFLRSQGYYELV